MGIGADNLGTPRFSWIPMSALRDWLRTSIPFARRYVRLSGSLTDSNHLDSTPSRPPSPSMRSSLLKSTGPSPSRRRIPRRLRRRMTKTRKRRMRKRKVERTISNGRRKSNASLLGGGPGWSGLSASVFAIAEGCERSALATSSLRIRETDERRAGCDLTADECGICALPMAEVWDRWDPPGSSLRWIRRRIRWETGRKTRAAVGCGFLAPPQA